MKNYELALVINPTFSDEKVKGVVSKVEEIISGLKGKVTSTDIWPKKALAYKIGKHKEAYYAILGLEVSNISPETNKKIRLIDGVIRYLLVNK